MTITSTVGELRFANVGQVVTMDYNGVTITGPLTELRREGQPWSEPGDEDHRVSTFATIGGWTSPDLPPNTPVVIS